MKDKFINFRASEQEIKELNRLAKRARMTKTDFIRHAIFNKDIIVIDGLKELQKQLKPIGNNLNQLTTRANMGQFETVYLNDTKEELSKIHQALTTLCEKKNALTQPEMEEESPEETTVAPPVETPMSSRVYHESYREKLERLNGFYPENHVTTQEEPKRPSILDQLFNRG
ncbi:MobC family plasmid mobilization relaxosome protein [Bengtsoniella intestinalis]|uniref:MobC family plasmid mobilization relaxosome protein n=1 Tax=Bengtsoniella intestinalis TaxID=3073143 RepID=UPI00391F07E9